MLILEEKDELADVFATYKSFVIFYGIFELRLIGKEFKSNFVTRTSVRCENNVAFIVHGLFINLVP